MVSASARCSGQRSVPIRPVDDQLGKQRVVPVHHLVALADAGVDPDARRPPQADHATGRRQEARGRVLRVQACLERVTREPDLRLVDAQRLAGRDPQLIGPPGHGR